MKKQLLILSVFLTSIVGYTQVSTINLEASYPLDGGAFDVSGNNLSGTVNGAIMTTNRFGEDNKAYYFDGVDDYIEIVPGINLDTMSISLWFQTTSSTGALFSKHQQSSFNGSYFIQLNNNEPKFYITGTSSNASNIIDTVDANDNIWHHLVVTYDNQVMKLYTDGYLVDSLVTSIGVNQSTVNTIIGAWRNINNTGYTGYYEGKIDDILVYSRVLSSAEVLELSNDGICKTNITVTDTLIINLNTTGYNPLTFKNTIKAYPNPTSSDLIIDNGNYLNLNGYSVKIINSLSQVVYNSLITQQIMTVNLSSFGGAGLYFLQVINDRNEIVDIKKIVLQ